jgi:predicted transcriptional regulator
MSPTVSQNQRRVLEVLATYRTTDQPFRFFSSISEETGLAKQRVRHACRSLKRKGLVDYSAVYNEAGPCGSGYGCNQAGAAWLAQNQRAP